MPNAVTQLLADNEELNTIERYEGSPAHIAALPDLIARLEQKKALAIKRLQHALQQRRDPASRSYVAALEDTVVSLSVKLTTAREALRGSR